MFIIHRMPLILISELELMVFEDSPKRLGTTKSFGVILFLTIIVDKLFLKCSLVHKPTTINPSYPKPSPHNLWIMCTIMCITLLIKCKEARYDKFLQILQLSTACIYPNFQNISSNGKLEIDRSSRLVI